MLQKLDEILNFEKYNPNTPKYEEYASSIYIELIKDQFCEYSRDLPSNYYDFIKSIKLAFKGLKNQEVKTNINPSISIDNLSSIVEVMDDMKLLFNSNDTLQLIFLQIIILQKTHLLTAISLQSNRLIFSNDEVLHFLEKKIQFSQAEIAKEWEVDNDTLSKWFVIQYGTNIYKSRKKINLSEYLQIFNDFFVLDEDKRANESEKMIKLNTIDFYNSLALKGKTYSKKDIIEECFNPDEYLSPKQYSEAKKILTSRFIFYSEVNKFPASIAFRLINELRNFI